MIFVEDLKLKGIARGFLGKHCLDAGWGQFFQASVDRAQNQIEVVGLLGSVYYTQLGQYNKKHFKDVKVMSYLGQFENQLRDIEIEISKKNFSRLMPYKFLLPSQIPQSINI